ncbi:hypothetical protein U9M48_036132 [Paspalum notatum var. saurae]|uniref:acetyl-CoA C-acyltransferase n=1 Tax=Paspalum notatum var. saurae TaxID=547442 RepID=A0AAQ3UEL3_PASNO
MEIEPLAVPAITGHLGILRRSPAPSYPSLAPIPPIPVSPRAAAPNALLHARAAAAAAASSCRPARASATPHAQPPPTRPRRRRLRRLRGRRAPPPSSPSPRPTRAAAVQGVSATDKRLSGRRAPSQRNQGVSAADARHRRRLIVPTRPSRLRAPRLPRLARASAADARLRRLRRLRDRPVRPSSSPSPLPPPASARHTAPNLPPRCSPPPPPSRRASPMVPLLLACPHLPRASPMERRAGDGQAGVPLNEPATGLLGDGGCLRDVLPNGDDSAANRDLFFAGTGDAVPDVAAAIKAGLYDIGIAAGLESMSLDRVRIEWQVNPKVDLFSQARDCLPPMGITSENIAHRFGITRLEQDQVAKAAAAVAAGKFKEEIVPVHSKIIDPKTGEEKESVVSADDRIRAGTSLAVLSKLKPAFSKDGSTTAGNASQVSDGAGAVLLMRRDVAMKKGLPILGVFRSFAAVGVDPAVMGIGPAVAIPAAVKAAGLQFGDIDLFEINEAFASQYAYCCKMLELDPTKINVNGGAIALGHPLGATGARCVSTLLNEMKRRGKDCRFGVISMCIGSGMGAAAVFERGDSVDELTNAWGILSHNWLSKDAM